MDLVYGGEVFSVGEGGLLGGAATVKVFGVAQEELEVDELV